MHGWHPSLQRPSVSSDDSFVSVILVLVLVTVYAVPVPLCVVVARWKGFNPWHAFFASVCLSWVAYFRYRSAEPAPAVRFQDACAFAYRNLAPELYEYWLREFVENSVDRGGISSFEAAAILENVNLQAWNRATRSLLRDPAGLSQSDREARLNAWREAYDRLGWSKGG